MAIAPVEQLLELTGSRLALTLVEGTRTTCEWCVDELQAQRRYAADTLRALGLRKGDHLWLSSANNPHCIAVLLAAIDLGLCLCPLAVDAGSAQREWMARQRVPDLIVLDAQQQAGAFPAVPIVRLQELQGEWLGPPSSSLRRDAADIDNWQSDEEGQLLFHSSGSTGTPKAIAYPRERLNRFMRRLAELYAVWRDDESRSSPSDRITVLSLMHFGGLSFCLQSLLEGRTVHLLRSENPLDHLALLKRTRCQLLYLIPSLLEQMLATDLRRQLPDLRHCLAMGEAISPQRLTQLSRHLGFQVHNAYGMTEGLCGIYNSPDDCDTPMGSCGRLRFGEARLVDADRRDACEGELWVRNETMTPCYSDEQMNRQKFVEGWFRTGDCLRRDGSGYYFFVARQDLMCVINGRNVYPQEVEQVLALHPQVALARVAPITLRDGRVRLAAAITPRGMLPPAPNALLDFYLQHGAHFAAPVFVMFMAMQAGVSSFKTDRKQLGTLLQGSYDAAISRAAAK